MKNTSYKNVTLLKAIKILVAELTEFLDGWGDFDYIVVDRAGQKMVITITPKNK